MPQLPQHWQKELKDFKKQVANQRIETKLVRSTPYMARIVVYDKHTQRQVAVVTADAAEPDDETPFMTEWFFKVHAPIEGMNGWTIECNDWSRIKRIATRECYHLGKLHNRLITLPIAFLRGSLL